MVAKVEVGASKPAQADIDKLFAETIGHVIHALTTKGLPPMGATMSAKDGKIEAAITTQWFPKGDDIVQFLFASIQEHRKDYRAILIAYDTTCSTYGKGLTVYAEHIEGMAFTMFVPYTIHGLFKKRVVFYFGDMTFCIKERQLWCDSVIDSDVKMSKRIDG